MLTRTIHLKGPCLIPSVDAHIVLFVCSAQVSSAPEVHLLSSAVRLNHERALPLGGVRQSAVSIINDTDDKELILTAD